MAPLRQEDYMYDDFLNEPVAQPKKQEEQKKQVVPKKKNKVKKNWLFCLVIEIVFL